MYSSGFDYYPYSNYQPFSQRMPRARGLSSLFRRGGQAAMLGGIRPKFDWGSFLSNAQKTLNVVNQAIPIIYQIKPIWSNAKTMFKIVGALKEDDDKSKEQEKTSHTQFSPDTKEERPTFSSDNQPQFFI